MNENELRAWREGLQVGDKVAVRTRQHITLDEVTKVTPTLVRVGRFEQAYRKVNGWRSPIDRYCYATILPVTPEIEAQIELTRLRGQLSLRLGRVVPHRLDAEQCRILIKAIEEAGLCGSAAG